MPLFLRSKQVLCQATSRQYLSTSSASPSSTTPFQKPASPGRLVGRPIDSTLIVPSQLGSRRTVSVYKLLPRLTVPQLLLETTLLLKTTYSDPLMTARVDTRVWSVDGSSTAEYTPMVSHHLCTVSSSVDSCDQSAGSAL
jgi:hypothetical protein